MSNADANKDNSARKNYAKLGRITGYETDFTKSGIVGLLQVTSAASVYKTSRGAHKSLRLSAEAAAKENSHFKRLSVGKPLGSEARLYLRTLTNDGTKIDIYSLIWRTGRVYAAILGGGISGTVDPVAIVRLAMRQQGRIVDGLGR